MGIYIYSVRTKSIKVEGIDAPVYPFSYLTREIYGGYDPKAERWMRMQLGRAEATWERRNERPRFVVQVHDNKPEEGNEVWEWDGRAFDYDTPNFQGKGRRLGFLRRVGRKWTVSPVMFAIEVGRDIGPNHRQIERTEYAFSRVEAEDLRLRATMEGFDAWLACYEADPDPELDRITVENSAFRSFREMLDAKGGYRPSMDMRTPELPRLADAYDQAQELRGDYRRAYRYGVS